MKTINPYLTFNGNCREAMTFYQECLGGKLILQPIGETPMADKMPPEMKAHILHAELRNGDMWFMASDMCQESGLVRGNSVSLVLHLPEEEIHGIFDRLAAGGKVLHPLETTFWGALFGDLVDKFGHTWMLTCEMNAHKPN